jgi:hypothetical protein
MHSSKSTLNIHTLHTHKNTKPQTLAPDDLVYEALSVTLLIVSCFL